MLVCLMHIWANCKSFDSSSPNMWCHHMPPKVIRYAHLSPRMFSLKIALWCGTERSGTIVLDWSLLDGKSYEKAIYTQVGHYCCVKQSGLPFRMNFAKFVLEIVRNVPLVADRELCDDATLPLRRHPSIVIFKCDKNEPVFELYTCWNLLTYKRRSKSRRRIHIHPIEKITNEVVHSGDSLRDKFAKYFTTARQVYFFNKE